MDNHVDSVDVVVKKPGGNPNWKKGVSGNPGGRPKNEVNLIRTLCRGDTYKVYHALMEIIMDKNAKEAARVAAIKFHQETAWGKAPTSIKIETTSASTSPEFMPAQQLAALAQGKVDDFVYNLFSTGKLKEYVDKFRSEGTASDEPDANVVIIEATVEESVSDALTNEQS